ncbi:RNA polymerase sigma factor [Cyclobacterium xiamenense]|uniref:RNA polymerase sigma factor n=1 Tax=Cyclobacterium xiamenense TaxID=1297121 RepID=UPI0012BA0C04|nr:sigma-70 family RNA polymerase sigma factor [Cyclobacterium xiamenense]
MPVNKPLPSDFKPDKSPPGEEPVAFSADASAWKAFRQGNESAFIYIYERYFRVLYAYGFRIVADSSVVKDALQDMFIDLRERRRYLGDTEDIKFYLFKCLKRRLIRDFSAWQGKKEGLEAIPEGIHFSLSHETQLIDQQLTKEKIVKLNAAIARLSPRKREIIYYSFYEGLTYAQIQEIMGLENQQTTRNLMYKAIRYLRKMI